MMMCRFQRLSRLLLLTSVLAPLRAVAADVGAHWDSKPYRIQATLAIDAPGELRERLATDLPLYLDERVATAIGPVWQLETKPADGPLRYRLVRDVTSAHEAETAITEPIDDKRLFLSVLATPWGYRLTAREFDRYTQRWGQPLEARTRQLEAVSEELFALVQRAVTPLAKLEVSAENPKQVAMSMRAAALPRKSVDFRWTEPGDIFVPYLRRMTRDGQLAENGIQSVPWTYLEVLPGTAEADKLADDGKTSVIARIESGVPAPLSRRRRARTEQVAIAVRSEESQGVTLQLQSRTDRNKRLAGYQVQVQVAGDEELRDAGVSDEHGEIRIESGESPVELVSIKSSGTLLARVPVVPGLGGIVEIPLQDDTVRLEAAARLASLREDLVDLVARRNIFMARVRQQIDEKNYDQARELLSSLDELPGPTQFNQRLDREAMLHKSDDPQVQRRIDQLFAATELALGQFLDPRPIGELHDKLRAAEGKGG